jgi:hypothetical protein
MAFSKSSLPLLLGPFINSFIIICESNAIRESGWIITRNVVIKISITDIWLYIYTISNTSSFEMNRVFFCGGPKLSPLIKHWVGGLFPPASYAPCGH